jgi:hypothetical protein
VRFIEYATTFDATQTSQVQLQRRTSMNELKQEQPMPEQIQILLRVIQLNELIAKQNSVIIQALTLPRFMVRPDKEQS